MPKMILDPGDQSREKLEFYSRINTQELLIIDRSPWQLELYRLNNGLLKLVETNDSNHSAPLTSDTTDVTFELRSGQRGARSQLIVRHPDSDRTGVI